MNDLFNELRKFFDRFSPLDYSENEFSISVVNESKSSLVENPAVFYFEQWKGGAIFIKIETNWKIDPKDGEYVGALQKFFGNSLLAIGDVNVWLIFFLTDGHWRKIIADGCPSSLIEVVFQSMNSVSVYKRSIQTIERDRFIAGMNRTDLPWRKKNDN